MNATEYQLDAIASANSPTSDDNEYWLRLRARSKRTDSLGHTMPRVNDMIESKYLKQADVPDPVIVTVAKIGKVNIAKEGDPPEEKWAIRFREFTKPMLLNSTNIKLLEKACGSDDTDDWIAKEVILYTDDSVSFGGQVVGGLRIRKQQAAPARKPAPSEGQTLEEMDNDIPFATSNVNYDMESRHQRRMRRYS